jgi:molybdate transport system ATP-binding protein
MTPPPPQALLTARVLVSRPAFTVDVDIDLARDQVLALMGPSGAGKSTLVDALAGLQPLDGGRITVDGTLLADATGRVHVPPERRGIGLLGQDPLLFPHLTAAGNVAFALRAHGHDRRSARADAAAWLARVGLEGHEDRRPAQLSGGQRQRVALARVLATRPSLLLLDEPFASLDVEAAAAMRTLVGRQLAAQHTAAIIVSHAVQDAAALADRVQVIEAGTCTSAGTLEEVLAHPRTAFVAALAAAHQFRPDTPPAHKGTT